ncbi:RimJ/RimL family protein N-acetyltransferase [Chryseobacterium defluvii]|uniref:RimJ/RimL family protein N-acetyltransferase n=1 Tax=Chryseobacterium defluvii TaxID=160396 RepID=A0A840KJP8_9FLAO|nr:GNAT family N-acetyltransferase [Chryseobacterium defluvii]MBB4807894.1 RimJ/RimL family protein N-acetyltransferase [Chryseobacterium defluvii]
MKIFTTINMTSLRLYRPEDLPSLSYTLDEVQSSFTALSQFALEKIYERSDGLAFPITILYENVPAGFFVLDFGDDKLELTDNSKSALVRSLSVNPHFQGKGIGTEAMRQIPGFLKAYFPDRQTEEVVLAVNFKNTSAYRLYLKAGYQDHGKTRVWKDSFQHLLSMKL